MGADRRAQAVGASSTTCGIARSERMPYGVVAVHGCVKRLQRIDGSAQQKYQFHDSHHLPHAYRKRRLSVKDR
jgi:hypothetical protein